MIKSFNEILIMLLHNQISVFLESKIIRIMYQFVDLEKIVKKDFTK